MSAQAGRRVDDCLFYHAGNVVPRPFAVAIVDTVRKGIDNAACEGEKILRHGKRAEGRSMGGSSIRRKHGRFNAVNLIKQEKDLNEQR